MHLQAKRTYHRHDAKMDEWAHRGFPKAADPPNPVVLVCFLTPSAHMTVARSTQPVSGYGLVTLYGQCGRRRRVRWKESDEGALYVRDRTEAGYGGGLIASSLTPPSTTRSEVSPRQREEEAGRSNDNGKPTQGHTKIRSLRADYNTGRKSEKRTTREQSRIGRRRGATDTLPHGAGDAHEDVEGVEGGTAVSAATRHVAMGEEDRVVPCLVKRSEASWQSEARRTMAGMATRLHVVPHLGVVVVRRVDAGKLRASSDAVDGTLRWPSVAVGSRGAVAVGHDVGTLVAMDGWKRTAKARTGASGTGWQSLGAIGRCAVAGALGALGAA